MRGSTILNGSDACSDATHGTAVPAIRQATPAMTLSPLPATPWNLLLTCFINRDSILTVRSGLHSNSYDRGSTLAEISLPLLRRLIKHMTDEYGVDPHSPVTRLEVELGPNL